MTDLYVNLKSANLVRQIAEMFHAAAEQDQGIEAAEQATDLIAQAIREAKIEAYEEAAKITSEEGWKRGDPNVMGVTAYAALRIRALRDSLEKTVSTS